MASKVPGYMRSTAAAKGRRPVLGSMSGNVRPSSAAKPSASDSVAPAKPDSTKDVLKAKELVLDAKAAETLGERGGHCRRRSDIRPPCATPTLAAAFRPARSAGKLREALSLYRQALKLVPASHMHKLRTKLNAVRDALRLQKAAAAAVSGAAEEKKAELAPVPRKTGPRHLANVRSRVPSRFAPKTARPASARVARPGSAVSAPRASSGVRRPATAAKARSPAKKAASPPRAADDEPVPVPSPAPPAPQPAPSAASVLADSAAAPSPKMLDADSVSEEAPANDVVAAGAEPGVEEEQEQEEAEEDATPPTAEEEAVPAEAEQAAPAAETAAPSPAAAASPAPSPRSMTVPSTGNVVEDSLLAMLNSSDEPGLTE